MIKEREISGDWRGLAKVMTREKKTKKQQKWTSILIDKS
jgi:hypothetical protein